MELEYHITMKLLTTLIAILICHTGWAEEVKNGDFYIDQAIHEINRTYGDRVSVKGKSKRLLKFGETSNADNGTETTDRLLTFLTHPTFVPRTDIIWRKKFLASVIKVNRTLICTS